MPRGPTATRRSEQPCDLQANVRLLGDLQRDGRGCASSVRPPRSGTSRPVRPTCRQRPNRALGDMQSNPRRSSAWEAICLHDTGHVLRCVGLAGAHVASIKRAPDGFNAPPLTRRQIRTQIALDQPHLLSDVGGNSSFPDFSDVPGHKAGPAGKGDDVAVARKGPVAPDVEDRRTVLREHAKDVRREATTRSGEGPQLLCFKEFSLHGRPSPRRWPRRTRTEFERWQIRRAPGPP